jgi:hypothetical protein
MKYEVKHSRHEREWVVEAFNPEGDGEVYVAEFSGPDAKARATEYAAWKNSLDGHMVLASTSPNACLWPTATDLSCKV